MLQLAYDDVRGGRCSRRAWLRLSTLAGLGLATSGFAAERSNTSAATGRGFGRAKSVLLVFANGGQSQIDTWDPKPNAPLDVRGAFQPIATAVPGIQFCEHMPQIARVADRLTLVRSMSHEDLDHGSAAYLALTGFYHVQRSGNPDPSPNDLPTYGAILRRLRPDSRFVCDAIHVNGPAILPRDPGPGQNGGFLGRAFEPLVVGDPTAATGAIPGLASQADLPTVRLDQRLSLKQSLDQAAQRFERDQRALDLNRLYGQAYDVLASPSAREAFNLEAEPPQIRDRYGRHRSGQALLLGRRLVEAGVPYINVIWNHSNRGQDDQPDDTDLYGWDTHNDIFDALQNRLLPRFDQSFSALIEDLDQRGLLDQTLVVCMGEFGRAPRVALEAKFKGATPGRKHWATVYSIALAGAGVQRGAIVGASDRLGGEPVTERYGPWDVAATMFHALGLDPHGHYTDLQDRPYAIAQGKPIEALYRG
jgi:uncharacterized protein (DUF1501 family)